MCAAVWSCTTLNSALAPPVRWFVKCLVLIEGRLWTSFAVIMLKFTNRSLDKDYMFSSYLFVCRFVSEVSQKAAGLPTHPHWSDDIHILPTHLPAISYHPSKCIFVRMRVLSRQDDDILNFGRFTAQMCSLEGWKSCCNCAKCVQPMSLFKKFLARFKLSLCFLVSTSIMILFCKSTFRFISSAVLCN